MGTADRAAPAAGGRIRWTRWRRVTQLVFVAFFLALPVTNRLGQVEVLGNLASLRLGPVSLVDPATGISEMLAGAGVTLAVVGGLALPLLLAFALGPVFCSWVCPWGLLSELIDDVATRWRRPPVGARRPRLRWGLLAAVLVASAVAGMPLVATLSAPRAISTLPLELVFFGTASAATVGILGVVLLVELAAPRRLWCRALCPVGAALVAFRWPRTLTVRWSRGRCRGEESCTGACARSCSWGLDPRRLAPFDGCTSCGACVEACRGTPCSALALGFGAPTGGPRPHARSCDHGSGDRVVGSDERVGDGL